MLKIISPPTFALERLEKYCKSRIKKNPGAYFPRVALAEIYKYYKKYEEAREQYKEIMFSGEMRDIDYINYGEVLFRLKAYDSAVEIFFHVIDKHPHNKIANWCMGNSLMIIGEYDRAVVYLERLLLAGSKRDVDYWTLARCYDGLGELEKAKTAYTKALTLKPDSVELKEDLASINRRLQEKI